MRFIDYYLGRVCCALLTLHRYTLKFFLEKNVFAQKPKKILFIKFFGLGSIALLRPAIQKIKNDYPEAQLFFLSFSQNKKAIEFLHRIPEEHIFSIRSKKIRYFISDLCRVLYHIRYVFRVDTVIDFEFFSRFSALVSYLSGAGMRIGLHHYKIEGLKRGDLFTHRVPYNGTCHVSRVFFALAISLGANDEDHLLWNLQSEFQFPARFPLCMSSGVKESVFLKLQSLNRDISPSSDLILCSPGGDLNTDTKTWPINQWSALCRKILDSSRANTFLIFTGVDSQKWYGEAVKAEIPSSSRIINLAGMTNLEEFFALCSLGKLMISIDSGPMHVAANFDIPLIALFGSSTPQEWGPLSNRASVLHKDYYSVPGLTILNGKNSPWNNSKEIADISPEEVFATYQKMYG